MEKHISSFEFKEQKSAHSRFLIMVTLQAKRSTPFKFKIVTQFNFRELDRNLQIALIFLEICGE